jgi:hypothetical protein
MKGIKDDILGREASLALWDDFLYEVNYNRSVILNWKRTKPYSLHALAKKVGNVLGPGK